MEEKKKNSKITPDGRATGRISFKDIQDWLVDVLPNVGSTTMTTCRHTAAEYGKECARLSLYTLLRFCRARNTVVTLSDVRVLWKDVWAGLDKVSNAAGMVLVERMRNLCLENLNDRLDGEGLMHMEVPCEIWTRAEYLDVSARSALALMAAYGLPLLAGTKEKPVPFFPDFSEGGFFSTNANGKKLSKKEVEHFSVSGASAFVQEWVRLGQLIEMTPFSAPKLSDDLLTRGQEFSWAVFMLGAHYRSPYLEEQNDELLCTSVVFATDAFRRIFPDDVPSPDRIRKAFGPLIAARNEHTLEKWPEELKDVRNLLFGWRQEDEDGMPTDEDDTESESVSGDELETGQEMFLSMADGLKNLLNEMQNDIIKYRSYNFPKDIDRWVEDEIKVITKHGWKGDETLIGRLRFFTGLRQAFSSIRSLSGKCALICEMIEAWLEFGRPVFPSCCGCEGFIDCLGPEFTASAFVIDVREHLKTDPRIKSEEAYYGDPLPSPISSKVDNMMEVLQMHGVVGKDISPDRLTGWTTPIRELMRINEAVMSMQDDGNVFRNGADFNKLPDDWAKLFRRSSGHRNGGRS